MNEFFVLYDGTYYRDKNTMKPSSLLHGSVFLSSVIASVRIDTNALHFLLIFGLIGKFKCVYWERVDGDVR